MFLKLMIYNNSFARNGRAADPASTLGNPPAQPSPLGAAGWLAARMGRQYGDLEVTVGKKA
jgi:hypothetical protein